MVVKDLHEGQECVKYEQGQAGVLLNGRDVNQVLEDCDVRELARLLIR